MKLRTEFLLTVCAKSEARSGTSGVNLFDMLYCEEGLNAMEHWFNAREEKPFRETHFLPLMRKCTDLSDFEILTLFDVFDFEQRGYILFRDVFLLLALLAARDSKATTKLLYLNGPDIFRVCCLGIARRVRPYDAVRFLEALNFNEEPFYLAMDELGFPDDKCLNIEEFTLLMFAVFSAWDNPPQDSFLERQAARLVAVTTSTPTDLDDKRSVSQTETVKDIVTESEVSPRKHVQRMGPCRKIFRCSIS
mmetsp:Transcript_9501/g.21774  ORF Transcript_9501/g.21774 Transcript_9501/m.21774 type:complete len:249 (+) Transcript_9501:1-747(+)